MGNLISFRRGEPLKKRFERLMAPHFDALHAAARRMAMSPHDAEDLVQEVCIKALQQLDELERVDYPRAWLLRVMYNQFVDETRRAARSPVDAAWTGERSADPDEIACHTEHPEELTDRDQKIKRVIRAMRCLNADHCALVAMHDVEGLSISELCQLTGMPEGTIKAQLHRTRKKLGRLLQNDAVTKPHLRVIGGKQ